MLSKYEHKNERNKLIPAHATNITVKLPFVNIVIIEST